jgi:hypothetical protein
MTKKMIAASAVAALALSVGSVATASAHDNKGRKGEGISNILTGLVTKGTLTQAQVDAITKAMTDARDAAKAAHDAAHAAHLKVITDTLGIDATALKARLDAGDSLATIAGTKKDALIAALVAFETSKIDAAVTAGKVTAAQATTMKSNLKDRVTALVESTKGVGKGPKGHFGSKGKGRGGH